MGKRKLLIVLYFLSGPSPTDDDTAAMSEYGYGYVVRQRNSLQVHNDEALEEFDIVAGAVPDQYAAAALEKGEPEEPITPPPVNAKDVAPGSPVSPPKAPEKAAGKPKQPAPKPGAGWTPNA